MYTRCRHEFQAITSNHSAATKRVRSAGLAVEISGHGILTEDKCTDRLPRQREQRWVATPLGREIVSGEADMTSSGVVVDREVGERLVTRLERVRLQEFRAEHTIAVATRHIIDAVLSKTELPCEEAKRPAGPTLDAGKQHGPVLILVAGKEMRVELRVHRLRDRKSPVHYRLSIHASTFKSLWAAV